MNVCISAYVTRAVVIWGCEWNKVHVASLGEEVITLNVGHLGAARGLIISLNASGFPMFSPYAHCWPMTHQPLHLILSLYCITLIVKHHVGGLGGSSLSPSKPQPLVVYHFLPSSYKWRKHAFEGVYLRKFCTYYEFFLLDSKEPDRLSCWPTSLYDRTQRCLETDLTGVSHFPAVDDTLCISYQGAFQQLEPDLNIR